MYLELSEQKIVHHGFITLFDNVHIYFKGYVIWEGRLFYDEEFLSIIKSHFSEDGLRKNIPKYNGAFNLIIIRKNQVEVYVDRWGVFPLYYINKNNLFTMSNNWNELTKASNKKIRKDAAVEMITFGYVMGDKTLIDDIYEIAPHSITLISNLKKQIQISQESYWEFKYSYRDIRKERVLEKSLYELWKNVIDEYSGYVKEHGNLAYIPMSGGLDSRLLAAYFDRSDVDIYSMTFGSSPASREIQTAQKIIARLNHVLGHNIIFFSNELLKLMYNAEPGNYDSLTCGHYERKLLFFMDIFRDKTLFYVPGHDANFMAGDNLKLKMLKWTNADDIINYILKFKSSALTMPLIKNIPDYGEILKESLKTCLTDEEDLLNSFNRWNCEQRQRRYIIRSSVKLSGDHVKLLMPFFDYRIMDFFMDLPLDFLFNQRLYVNTQLTHLFRFSPDLIKVKRDGKQRQRRIRNNYFTEYYPKLKSRFQEKLGLKTFKVRHWPADMNWEVLEKDFGDLDFIDTEWTKEPRFALNLFYLKTINEVITQL